MCRTGRPSPRRPREDVPGSERGRQSVGRSGSSARRCGVPATYKRPRHPCGDRPRAPVRRCAARGGHAASPHFSDLRASSESASTWLQGSWWATAKSPTARCSSRRLADRGRSTDPLIDVQLPGGRSIASRKTTAGDTAVLAEMLGHSRPHGSKICASHTSIGTRKAGATSWPSHPRHRGHGRRHWHCDARRAIETGLVFARRGRQAEVGRETMAQASRLAWASHAEDGAQSGRHRQIKVAKVRGAPPRALLPQTGFDGARLSASQRKHHDPHG